MRRARFFCVAVGLLCLTEAAAQYPAKPITFLVSNLGGAPDLTARLIGQRLGEVFQQPVLIEPRPGSNGVIASDIVAKYAPNGYTFIFGPESNVVINPHLYAKMPFNALKDLIPVASAYKSNFVLAINPSVPARNLQQFVEYAKKANPSLSYASGGNGSQHHLLMEMLKTRAGIDLMHVPYKGGSGATMAAVAGDVAVLFAGPSIISQVRSGQLRAIAVSGEKRSSVLPDVPTIAETYPGHSMNPWGGLFGPAGTPAAVIARLRTEMNKVLAQPDIPDKMDNMGGLMPFVTTPEELSVLIRNQYASYGKIIKSIGATLD